MGFGQFLQQQGLSPDVNARLQEIYDTPDGLPPAADDAGNAVAPGASSPIPGAGYKTVRNAPGMIDMRPAAATPRDAIPGAPAVPTSEAPKTPEEARAAAEQWGGPEAGDVAAAGVGSGAGAPDQRGIATTPGHYVPPHWQPGSRSEARREGFNPDELQTGQEHRLDASGQRILSADKHLEAAQQQGVADAVYAAAHTQASQQAAAQMQAIQQQKERYIQDQQAKMNDLAIRAQQKVDPEAAKGSSGAQLMAAIGVALGQYGASITGGTNTAMQIVQSNIDRNIKAQEANIANAGRAHEREQSLYHQNLEAFGDRERAVLATKVAYLDQVKGMADQQYAQAKHTANEGQYHDFLAGISDERAKAADDFAKLTHTQVETQGNEHYVPGQVVGGTPAGKPLENLVTLPNGTTVQAGNEKQYNEIVTHSRIIGNLQALNNKALKLKEELYKMHPLNPMNHTAISSIEKQLQDMEIEKTSLLSGKDGEGVQRDSEFARNVAKRGFYTEGTSRFRSGLLSPSDQKSADAAIRAQNERADQELERFAVTGGAHIVKRGKATDANGNTVPVAKYTGQTAAEPEQLAPHGSVPMKPGLKIPTANTPLAERTDYDEDFGQVPAGAPAAGSKKGAGKSAHIHGGRK